MRLPRSSSKRPRVAVAMSGGVDSAVAALMLAEQGYDVIGITLKLFCYGEADDEATERSCCSLESIDDARRCARMIGARHVVLDFADEFRATVLDGFSRDYLAGRTPSPCVACNSEIKFNRFLLRALRFEADYIATGHYARLTGETDGAPTLRAGIDDGKDQSYFLWGIERDALSRILLPVGDLTKSEVRAQARRAGLPVAEKTESMDICFVPGGDYGAFLERERVTAPGDVSDRRWRDALAPGPIVDPTGRRVGTHRGYARYTVGQRRGLGVAAERPLYVTSVDPQSRSVSVGFAESLLAGGCAAESANFLVDAPAGSRLRARARIRHRHAPVASTVDVQEQGRVRVCFDEAQRAVAAGQSVVFYDGDRVLGGAVIAEAIPAA